MRNTFPPSCQERRSIPLAVYNLTPQRRSLDVNPSGGGLEGGLTAFFAMPGPDTREGNWDRTALTSAVSCGSAMEQSWGQGRAEVTRRSRGAETLGQSDVVRGRGQPGGDACRGRGRLLGVPLGPVQHGGDEPWRGAAGEVWPIRGMARAASPMALIGETARNKKETVFVATSYQTTYQ